MVYCRRVSRISARRKVDRPGRAALERGGTMGIPMDYGSYAPTYAKARWAMPWIVGPLLEAVRRAGPDCHPGTTRTSGEAAGRPLSSDSTSPGAVATGTSGRQRSSRSRPSSVQRHTHGLPSARLPQGVLQKVDVLTPNETEAAELAGLPAGGDETAAARNPNLRWRPAVGSWTPCPD